MEARVVGSMRMRVQRPCAEFGWGAGRRRCWAGDAPGAQAGAGGGPGPEDHRSGLSGLPIRGRFSRCPS